MRALAGEARYRHNYALMLAQAGELAAAERELEAAIELEPRNAVSHGYLGVVRQQLGRPDAAAYRAALHVQEHRFTTAGLADAIRALELEFLGFELTDPDVPCAYRERFPDDPTATSLERWGRFEAEHPHVFAGMYQFWVGAPA
jgi:tetratricopeptide (TPR) repeat protein